MTETKWVLLFSYGTLQNKNVQMGSFGRELAGTADALPRFRRRMVTVTDPRVLELSGSSQHPNAERSSDAKAEIAGTVFEVTEEELDAADKYEEASDYGRILVVLKSGKQAWVYVHRKAE
jgi:gamma-glutamylcyclotransferase (GGCT)/AIG2-like uncharacterized protein YtfP